MQQPSQHAHAAFALLQQRRAALVEAALAPPQRPEAAGALTPASTAAREHTAAVPLAAQLAVVRRRHSISLSKK